jgi:regulator of sirC expression with transglutaminase-like and TPR domain
VIARILRNLKLIHARAGDWARALPVSHKLVALEAGIGAELRDRGRILEHLEAFRAAAADYARYLELHPDADDARAVETQLDALRSRVSRLN